MYELNRTNARWAFKDLLGQANHFLITILVGLDGVRSGEVEIGDEFRTSWNPKSVTRSADRSRVFVLDLALIRAIDAMDTYFTMSARKPCALDSRDFIAAMDGSGRSVAKRLDVFDAHLGPLEDHHKAVLSIAINWRNRRVHSLSKDEVDKKTIRTVIDNAEKFENGYSGLNINEFVAQFKLGEAPSFKEAASVIRLTHEAVEHFDKVLLQRLSIEGYLKEAMLQLLEANNSNIARSIKKTWDHPEKKVEKVVRLLRMVGVNKTSSVRGRRIPDEFISSIVALRSEEVIDFLKN